MSKIKYVWKNLNFRACTFEDEKLAPLWLIIARVLMLPIYFVGLAISTIAMTSHGLWEAKNFWERNV